MVNSMAWRNEMTDDSAIGTKDGAGMGRGG